MIIEEALRKAFNHPELILISLDRLMVARYKIKLQEQWAIFYAQISIGEETEVKVLGHVTNVYES